MELTEFNLAIGKLVSELLENDRKSTCQTVHSKTDKALADIKRARTLVEKANRTLEWNKHQKTLCENTRSITPQPKEI